MHHPHPTRVRRIVLGAAALSLVLAACGSDDDSDGDSAAADTTLAAATPEPDTTDPATTNGNDTADLRVVSLSPTHTEIMFAIGAGDLLVAVDEFSTYPAEALELPNELSGYEPNVEAIAAFEPDLVLIGGDFTGLGDQLAAVGIEMWDGPAASTLADTYDQIVELGELTGHQGEAAELVAGMQLDIDEIIRETPELETPLTYFHELDPLLYSADSTTFVGQLYGLFGLQNIADEAGASAGGWPQLSAEFVVSADPDLIFLADPGETPETVAARPGWADIAAVTSGNIVVLDPDLASRWGPRVVDFVRVLSGVIQDALVSA